MSLYDDPRWEEIFDLPNPKIPMQPIIPRQARAVARLHGFNSPIEMTRQWDKFVNEQDWSVQKWPEQHRRAKALVNEHYETCRQLEQAMRSGNFPEKISDRDSNKNHAVERTFSSLSVLKAKIDCATKVQDLKDAREAYGKSNAILVDYIFDPVLADYRRWMEDLRKKDLQAAAERKLTGYKQQAASEVRKKAQKTGKITNADGKAIRHMVSVAINLRDGSFECGRAGHGLTANVLEPVFGFTLPAIAASAFSTEDPYNCAELEALYLLKTQHQGVAMKDVYFASMMPGGSHIIPPCVNCQRWIKDNDAKAAGFND